MSGSIVRRLTAAFILAAILCLAAPAAAAPAGSFLSLVVSGPGLFDQLLAWLGSLWPGLALERQGTVEKGGTPLSGNGDGGTNQTRTLEPDRSSAIDPNG